MFKKDNLRYGLALGFIAPFLGMALYYLIVFLPKKVGFNEFIGYLLTYKSLLTAVSSLSLVANAVFFTIFVNGRKDQTAKGIFVATLIYGIVVLLTKLIG